MFDKKFQIYFESLNSVSVVYQMHGNLHGYLPTNCDPRNVVVNIEIVVPIHFSVLAFASTSMVCRT